MDTEGRECIEFDSCREFTQSDNNKYFVLVQDIDSISGSRLFFDESDAIVNLNNHTVAINELTNVINLWFSNSVDITELMSYLVAWNSNTAS